tara:strand:- start:356 stop:610 length:255 start_codon:yes stop_codon:yes gene_type:complete
MNNTELTLDQLSQVAGGAPHITTWEGFGSKSSSTFIGPISGEGVFRSKFSSKASVIVGDNHFRAINRPAVFEFIGKPAKPKFNK